MTQGKQPKDVRDYLDSLIWDRKKRIDGWLIEYAGAEDTAYVRAVSRDVLVAAVRRARQPGCKLDDMVVLAGPQGSGKTSALRILACDEWFTASIPLGSSPEIIEATAGKWIVEASELRRMGKGDAAAFKEFLSCREDVARLPYQKEVSRVPRQFVLVGTTTEIDYLSDAPGNRRFRPVRIARFDLDRLRADRDQLWAEAAAVEATNSPLFGEENAVRMLAQQKQSIQEEIAALTAENAALRTELEEARSTQIDREFQVAMAVEKNARTKAAFQKLLQLGTAVAAKIGTDGSGGLATTDAHSNERPVEATEDLYAYVVIDDRFGAVFSSLNIDAACMYISTKLQAQATESTLVNPASYRIKRVKAG